MSTQIMSADPQAAKVTSEVVSAGPTILKLRVLEAHQHSQAMAIWQKLEERIESPPLAASQRWTQAWLEVYGPTIRFRFLLSESQGEPIGIALLTESCQHKGFGLSRQTRHLGTAGDSNSGSACVEYNALLVAPEWRTSFIDAISHWLLTQAGGDLLQLDGFLAEEAAELSATWPALETCQRESKYLDLQMVRLSETELITHFGRSTRANLRKRLREYGDLHTEWANDLDQARGILEELIEMHQARWSAIGEPGAFASQHFLAFQRSLLTQLFPHRQCVVFRVRQRDRTVGCLLLLVDRGRLLDYLSGFAPFEQMPSPGMVTHYLCQCEALQRGYSAYDFLVGDKRHKDNLSSHSQMLAWVEHARPTFMNRFISALTHIKRKWKHRSQAAALSSSSTTRLPQDD